MPFDMDRVLEQWRDKLLDLTKRNGLISCKLGKRGALPLRHPRLDNIASMLIEDDDTLTFVSRTWLLEEDDGRQLMPPDGTDGRERRSAEQELSDCLASPRLESHHALTELTDKEATARLYRLYLNARTSLQEQGINTLYLALGFLKWYESEDDPDGLFSPLLLAPVRLFRENLDAPWQLRLIDEDVVRNFALVQRLKTDFLITLPELDEAPDTAACRDYLSRVEEECSRHSRWELMRDTALGLFSFQKMAMWEDLGKNRSAIGSHGMCRAIGGDTETDAIEAVELPPPAEFDEVIHPKDTFHILDCDSSQLEAIVAAKQGASLIVDGPPGTGKSQTIANMIAESLADGKTVLFVSEKVAALEVVKRRLDACNLGDFCLELHSHKSNKKVIVDELGRCLDLPRQRSSTPRKALAELYETRRQLNQYARALHRPQAALNVSLFDAVGRYERLRSAPQLDCDIPNVLDYSEGRLETAIDVVRALSRLSEVVENFDVHPWRGCRAEDASLTLQRNVAEALPQLIERLRKRLDASRQLAHLGFEAAERLDVESLQEPVERAQEALDFPDVPESWFEGDPQRLACQVHRLARDARAYQRQCAKLNMFDLDQALACDTESLAERVAASTETEGRLRQHDDVGVRDLLARVQSVCSALERIENSLQRFVGAEENLREPMGLPPCATIADAARVIQLAEAVGDVGTCKPGWFDPERRAALCTASAEADRRLKRAAEITDLLAERVTGGAFAEEVAGTWRAAAEYDRWWKRLLPGWWRCRRQLLQCYRAAPPSGRILQADAKFVIERAECRRSADELAKRHEEEILAEGAEVRWRATRQGLERLDQHLADWGGPVPEEVRGLLVQWERTRAELLMEDASTLEARLRDLRGAVDDAAALVRYVGGRSSRWDQLSVDAFSRWVRECRDELTAWLQILKEAEKLLAHDRDTPWHELAAKLRELRELQESRDGLRKAYESVEYAVPGLAAPETYDWASEAKLADWLSGFVDAHDGRPPHHLIATCSDPLRRQAVAEAVALDDGARDAKYKQAADLLLSLFPMNKNVSRGIVLNTATVDEVIDWLSYLQEHISKLRDWLDLRSVRRRLSPRGLLPLFEELRAGSVVADELPDAFLRRFWELWLDAAFDTDPELSAFRAISHDDVVERFRQLDVQSIEGSAKRIRSKLLSDRERPDGEALGGPLFDELRVLRHERQKKRRHLPLRQLFARIPQVLLRLKPCVMMSPLSVSTFFDSDWIRFDVVIFDEASQVRPHDSIGAIYRGNQLVVAGDQRQLPPTSFFEHDQLEPEDEEEEQEFSSSDLESILDVCQSLGVPRRRLRWHYRSRREPLIAFSNRHIYSDELMTFPSVLDADGQPAIEFEHVPGGRFASGSNPHEAEHVAKVVAREMRRDPNVSIGVVTFGIGQRDAVQAAIYALLDDPESHDLRGRFADSEDEPWFVKNLENVQGDERDLMIFSIGYTPPPDKATFARFGPLNNDGGERRLNVAITRARSRVIVVSSIKSEAIDLSRTNKLGVKLLRAYLEYAEQGPSTLGSEVREDSERDFESDFEREVAAALEDRGYVVKRQVGCGGFRLDLALASHDRPGRYVLGVECDGATYHRHATARDRDRLRQLKLEDLGWTICRIWSTAWYRDPEREIQKVEAAFRAATEADLARERVQVAPDRAQPACEDRAVRSDTSRSADREPAHAHDGPARAATLEMPPLNGDLAEVEAWARSLGAETWLKLAAWGRRSKNLEYGEQRLLNDVAVRLRTDTELTERLTRRAHQLYEKARYLGFSVD